MKKIVFVMAVCFICSAAYADDSVSKKSIYKSASEYFGSFSGLTCNGVFESSPNSKIVLKLAVSEETHELEGTLEDKRRKEESKIYNCRGVTDNELLCIVDAGRISVPLYFTFTKNRHSVEAESRMNDDGEISRTRMFDAKCSE